MHHHSEGAVLPLTWVPTKGNDIPPLAVPLHGGQDGQLYIARGLLWGEMHIGSTSYASSTGARIRDKTGRTHVLFEYEVLTCASSVRFTLEPAPLAGTERTTPRWPRREFEEAPSPDTPPPKPHGKLTPFPWMSPPRGQPETLPQEKGNRNDPPRYTGPRGGRPEPPKAASPMPLSSRESVQFDYLAQTKCFTLIDDTPSMQDSWKQTRAALTGVIDVLSSESTWDGLDVRFLHHADARPCIKTAAEFERLFGSVPTWRGEKRMAAKVSQVFAESLSLICDTPNPRPVVLLILTDGMAVDNQELFNAVIAFSQRLNEKNVASHMFRIHLLQMGEDRKAVKPLHDFRDRITQRDRERRILNVVSFHRARGLLSAQSILKLLLGTTSIPVEEDPNFANRESPRVIEGKHLVVESIRSMGTSRR